MRLPSRKGIVKTLFGHRGIFFVTVRDMENPSCWASLTLEKPSGGRFAPAAELYSKQDAKHVCGEQRTLMRDESGLELWFGPSEERLTQWPEANDNGLQALSQAGEVQGDPAPEGIVQRPGVLEKARSWVRRS
jgi:hypothetical protein